MNVSSRCSGCVIYHHEHDRPAPQPSQDGVGHRSGPDDFGARGARVEAEGRLVSAAEVADSSVRKEQKVRAGFVPQEDIGAFRGRRQLEADSKRGIVPGSARPVGLAGLAEAAAAVHPQAAEVSPEAGPKPAQQVTETETKAKTEVSKSGHNWDSESDDDELETVEEARKAFGGLNVNDLETFPALGAQAKAKPERRSDTDGKDAKASGSGGTKLPAQVSVPQQSASPSSSTPLWRAKRGGRGGAHAPTPTRTPTKPHPIQGGRKGPIGLAFPPSVEEYERSLRQSTPDRPRQQKPHQRQTPKQSHPQPNPPSQPASAPPQPTPPRVRPTPRVRQGGALGAIRDTLLQNQAADARKPPRGKGESRDREASKEKNAGGEKKAGGEKAASNEKDASIEKK